MPNPFDALQGPEKDSIEYDEWGGMFSCSTRGCSGFSRIAKFFPIEHVLAWECQEGHISKIEDVYE